MEEICAVLQGLDWSPLYISLKTGAVATVISFFLGLFAARKVIKAGPKIKAVADGLLTLPMVLPPTVAGFFLLLLFSRRRPLGMFLYDQFDIKVVQSWLGCIIAATVIAFPLMYRNARAAFEQIDVNLVYAGRTLGMSEAKIFWKVVIPTAGARDYLRNHPDFCEGTGRVRGHFHACRKYSRQDRDYFPEDCHGHPGWRLSDCGSLGNYRAYHRIYRYLPDESFHRQEYEKRQALVKIRIEGVGQWRSKLG